VFYPVKWCTHVSLAVTERTPEMMIFMLFCQTSWYPMSTHFAISMFFMDMVHTVLTENSSVADTFILNCGLLVFQNQFLQSCCVHNHHSHAGPTNAWMSVWPSLNFALSLHHNNTPISSGSKFWCGKHILLTKTESHYNFLCGTKFVMSLPVHINLSYEQHLNESCAICYVLLLLHVPPPTKK
jgi:hypothetical protein